MNGHESISILIRLSTRIIINSTRIESSFDSEGVSRILYIQLARVLCLRYRMFRTLCHLIRS